MKYIPICLVVLTLVMWDDASAQQTAASAVGSQQGFLNASDPKADALMWLVYLRNGTTQYEDIVRYIRRDVERAHLDLADIGTSEGELEKLCMLGVKIDAQVWLAILRRGSSQYEGIISHIRDDVKKGGLVLADIGTSEEEFQKLCTLGAKVAVQNWLYFLRNDTGHREAIAGYIREEAAKGNLSLVEVGTSEEELNRPE